jgi:hypothetical protein
MARIWGILRFSVWTIGFVGGCSTPVRYPENAAFLVELTVGATAVFLVWCPLVCAAELLLNKMVRTNVLWQRPGLWISPFVRGKPLQFWFTVAMFILAGGLGLLVATLFRPDQPREEALPVLGSSVGMLAGIRLSLWLFRRRFTGGQEMN